MKRLESAVLTSSPFFSARWLGLAMGLLLLSLWAVPVRAAEDDPPARAGRLAEVEGQVWLYDTEGGEWIEARRNRPITSGDRLFTERGGRAELRVGSTVLRLDASSELEVTALDDEHLGLQLHSGSVAVRLRTREAAREFELVTAEGRFGALRTGSYRFDRDDDTTEATVASGQLQFSAPDSGVTVNAGQRAEFWNDGGTRHDFGSPREDAFSDWVAASEGREERSVSTRYVSPEMTGVEDLDRYGRWEQDSEYGPLWTPIQVAPGWAPYRMGHWAWISPWGWTWVDDAPWGFAPFHYGRWVQVRNTWCWSPGRYVARPVYAPALVAWVGGPHVNVSVRVGRAAPTVGWFPLAPHEVYVPGYRFTPRYLRHVNDGHVREISHIETIVNNPGRAVQHFSYRNRALPHAVTVVPSVVLERRQPVAPAIVGMNSRLHRETSRQSPRIDAPVPGGPRLETRRPGNVAVVVPPAPGRVGMPGEGREGRGWDGDGRRGERERREWRDGRDGRDGREARPPERDFRPGQPPVQQQFSRERRGEGQPVAPVQPAPAAPPSAWGRPAQPAPALGPREEHRVGRPPMPGHEAERSRGPRAEGPVVLERPAVPPPLPVRPPAVIVRESGEGGRPGFPHRDADERFRHSRPPGFDAPPRQEAPRPPAAVVAPPVAQQPPPVMRPPVVMQPPPQQPSPPPRQQMRREEERPGPGGGRPVNEPGRGGELPRHRQVN